MAPPSFKNMNIHKHKAELVEKAVGELLPPYYTAPRYLLTVTEEQVLKVANKYGVNPDLIKMIIWP